MYGIRNFIIFYVFQTLRTLIELEYKMGSELNYRGNPSGKEVLASKLEKIIEDYNLQVSEDAKMFEGIKQSLQGQVDKAVKGLEEVAYNRQLLMHTKMTEMITTIQEELQKAEGEEEELKQFVDCLSQFNVDIKTEEKD